MGWFPSSLFRRKDVEHLLGEMNEGDRLHRRLGAIALMGLGIGATIGTGLYVQTGRVANELLYRHALSPYVGRRLRGRVVRTIGRGRTNRPPSESTGRRVGTAVYRYNRLILRRNPCPGGRCS